MKCKRLIILIMAIIVCFLFTGCESQAVSAAKTAYANGNYEEVITALAEEEITDEEVGNMLLISKANVAFEEKNYEEVISLLHSFDAKGEHDIYAKSLDIAVGEAVETYDVEALATLLEMDNAISDDAYLLITEACNAFNYDAFCFLDKIIAVIPDGSLKENLNDYSAESGKTRTKAFMNGEWKIVYDEEMQDVGIVTLHVHEDDAKCVGFITQVSAFMEQYYYEVNDIYWQDMVFEGNYPISVYNTTRYTNGTIGGQVASVELDMEGAKMHIHVTGTVRPDRVYEKVA